MRACNLVVPEWPSEPFHPILKGETFFKRIQETVVLPKLNIVRNRFQKNVIFGKEMLAFNIIAMKIS